MKVGKIGCFLAAMGTVCIMVGCSAEDITKTNLQTKVEEVVEAKEKIANKVDASGIIRQIEKAVKKGEELEDRFQVKAGDIQEASVELKMGAGQINISGGAESLADVHLIYMEGQKPEVRYMEQSQKGNLIIKQPQSDKEVQDGKYRYEWNTRFSNSIPTNMNISVGAGRGDMDFSKLWIREVVIQAGAGDMKMNFAGKYKENVHVKLNIGAASSTLYVPKDIGVRVKVRGGLSIVDKGTLHKDQDIYTNTVYGSTDTIINIDVEVGVGQIKLIEK